MSHSLTGRSFTATLKTTVRTLPTLAFAFVAIVAAGLLAGCEPKEQVITAPAPDRVRYADNQNSHDFGKHVVHANALTTNQLTPEVAAAYKIVRSDKSAMLNVVVVEKDGTAEGKPVSATVNVSAANLTGQLKAVEMREIRDGDNIYFIGETSIANQETLIFEVDVMPEGHDEPLLFTYSQKFYVD